MCARFYSFLPPSARLADAAQKAVASILSAKANSNASSVVPALDRARERLDQIATSTKEHRAVERAAADAVASFDSVVQDFNGAQAVKAVMQAQKDAQDVLILAMAASAPQWDGRCVDFCLGTKGTGP